jgi:hypothetical protein
MTERKNEKERPRMRINNDTSLTQLFAKLGVRVCESEINKINKVNKANNSE